MWRSLPPVQPSAPPSEAANQSLSLRPRHSEIHQFKKPPWHEGCGAPSYHTLSPRPFLSHNAPLPLELCQVEGASQEGIRRSLQILQVTGVVRRPESKVPSPDAQPASIVAWGRSFMPRRFFCPSISAKPTASGSHPSGGCETLTLGTLGRDPLGKAPQVPRVRQTFLQVAV
jgi:hypothetical protein